MHLKYKLACLTGLALLIAPLCGGSKAGTIDVSGTWVNVVGAGDGPIHNPSTNDPIVGDLVDVPNVSGDPSTNSNAASAEQVYSPFPVITLTNTGDFITFTGKMTMQGAVVSAPTSGTPRTQFRFGLFKDNGNANNIGWIGYLMTNTHGTGTPAANLTRKNTGNTTNPMSTTGSATSLATTQGNGTVFQDDTFNLNMTITRAANGDLGVSGTITGTPAVTNFSQSLSGTSLAASVGSYAFDRLAFLLGGNLDMDRAAFADLQITSNLIPDAPVVDDLDLGDVVRGGIITATLPHSPPTLAWTLVNFTDPNGDPVVDGAVDPSTGEFSWNSLQRTIGAYTAIIRGQDGFARSDTGTLTFNLVPEPTSAVLLFMAATGLVAVQAGRDRGGRVGGK